MAATVITIAVEKGGCGKTVTTSNLAYLMGDEGKKVLCLDTDPQGNLTFALTGGNAITSKAFANRSLYDMIDGFRYNTQTRDFIVESEYENVDLIPANDQTPRLSKRLEDLYTDAQRDYDRGDPKYLASDTDVLDYFLRQVKDEYDYILIDTQPSRDSLLLSNAIAAADYVLIPLKCDSFSEDSVYYYDGRVRQLVRSLLCFSPSASGEGIDVMMYVGVDNFREPDRCQHLFTGEMKPYDTITHMVLTNQINEAEKMYICMLNPMHNRTPAVGLLSGIGSTPFFAPIALKTLISKEPLEENDRLLTSIKLDKDDYHLLRYYNMLVVNRPASLFLQ